ncbi:exodeoxyribonuclease VII large subunit [Salinibacter ruber]|uniref:exodeoxyribonuclease VII large subunit n=1 Tax=Salinibacter ruber TaxID=146919 RepID=UPI0002D85916|nr:exodeoxyribonuclease VII large subunit [Salinibacter ruber]MBB4061997.1 exodeoxyribonuclease VII large subunit [Salinibacter ruber]MCS3670456.1 exodeoxyribonuclease VII large subunit [Salinibacter ruber]MCS3936719.1 exodeoxyribonuclease VII large subunit [Salinibacter ruber]MCS4047266.1 exodeoxyribonuclease VII large subunit [Salinibacter ruber]MCS4141947.1 exodeoxyribonuclease VII large subunit [Salinibacter ruber]
MPPTNNTADDPVLSVAELTRGLSDLVEDRYDDVWVEGELSDFTRAASGHCYFSLKDEDAQIRCVMWKHLTQYVYFEPEEGMQVRVNGHASVYERRGDLQIQAQAMRQAGKGAQQKAFEELKQTLQAEGLFAPERKQALPAFPDTIGVVTSGQGAAIHDIQSGLARRFPPAEVVLCPVKVQGLDAPRAVADAVAAFNDLPADDAQRPDLLIVGRGGGSTEDLWAFNEEVVARALDASNLPVVSAVGHESDVTIADLVADERAATPSAAAERVVPDRRDVADRVRALHDRLRSRVTGRLQDARQRVDALVASRAFHAPARRLEQHRQHLDALVDRLGRGGARAVDRARTRLAHLRDRLHALDPEQPLRRGYVHLTQDGTSVQSAESLQDGDRVRLHFQDGRRDAEVLPDDG